MNFKHEKYFIDAINSGSIQEIKIAICLYIDKDATDSNGEIKHAIQYIDSNEINIWQEHKELENVKPKNQWNVDYIGMLQSDLMYNFSKERLRLILEVGSYVYGKKEIEKPISQSKNISKEISTNKESNLVGTKSNTVYTTNTVDREKQNNFQGSNNIRYDDIYEQRKNRMQTEYENVRDMGRQSSSNAKPVPTENSKGGIDGKGVLKAIEKRAKSFFKK